MPHKTTSKLLQRNTTVERARRYLTGGGVAREDSDDELGLEDIPWQWIYGASANDKSIESERVSDDSGSGEDEVSIHDDSNLFGRKRKARRGTDQRSSRNIIGARMGSFECKVGDCVLLKSESNNEAWVGLICDFVEDEDDGMAAHFMWFSTEKEIRNKEKKRKDFLQV